MKKAVIFNLVIVFFFLINSLYAHSSGRTDRRFGVYASFGEPTASLIGGNLAFNAFNFLKLHAGYGVTTIGASTLTAFGISIPASLSVFGSAVSISARNFEVGGRLLHPAWSFSPAVGAKYVSSSLTGNAFGFSLPLGSATLIVLDFGLDWQTAFGLHLAGGWQIPVVYSPSATLISAGSLIGVGSPFVNAGWFF